MCTTTQQVDVTFTMLFSWTWNQVPWTAFVRDRLLETLAEGHYSESVDLIDSELEVVG